MHTLAWFGKQGRYCLIIGLFVGLAAPAVAEALKPWIGALVALLLFVTGIRVGAKNAFGNLGNLTPALIRVTLFQMGLPLVAIALFGAAGMLNAPLALAVSLMLAAPSLTGAPNFAIMAGHDPAPGMRLLVLSTALFPLTALPVFVILDPGGGGVANALSFSFYLLVAILLSVGLGFAVRHVTAGLGKPEALKALDGCAALLLAVVVVGLMSAIGPLLRADPLALLGWVLVALGINFCLVVTTLWVSRKAGFSTPLATAVYSGNRNIALFLIVLPDTAAAPLLIFVGCYQIPMYLTPTLLMRLKSYAWARDRS